MKDGKDNFANAYERAVSVLRLLSEDADRQCKLMGYFQVARGIKMDIDGLLEPILSLPDHPLSDEQRSKIREIIDAVAATPGHSATIANEGRDENLRNMSDQSWVPIRSRAKELINLLETN